jgi:hypothetical protein
MGFLNHREGGLIFSQVFLRLHEFEEIEISGQSWRGDCEEKKKTLETGYRPRIRPLYYF